MARAMFAKLLSKSEDREGCYKPTAPAHMFANVKMIGTYGTASLLANPSKGHILIDRATVEEAAAQ